MSARILKFAPIGMVAGAMGYFCWSHFEEAAPARPSNEAAKPIEMTAALLKPPAAPELSRDPFLTEGVKAPPTPPTPKPKEVTHGQASAGAKAPAPGAKKSDEEPRHASSIDASAVAGLILNGTYVRGDQRLAVINGSVYAQGQRISDSAAANPAITVARVDVDKVVLKLGRGTSELLYSEASLAKDAPRRSTPARRDVAKKNNSPAKDPVAKVSEQAGGEDPQPTVTRAEPALAGPHDAGAPPTRSTSDASSPTH